MEQVASVLGESVAGPEEGELDRVSFGMMVHALLTALEAVSWVVVGTKDLRRITDDVLVEVKKGCIRFTATSLQERVIFQSPLVTVTAAGAVACPARKLLALVRQLDKSSEVAVDVADGVIEIRAGRVTWRLKVRHEAAEFPPGSDQDGIEFLDVDAAKLHSAISATFYAAAKGKRQSLMMLDVSDGVMRASDGVVYQQTLLSTLPDTAIPIYSVPVIQKLAELSEGSLRFGQTEEILCFANGQITFTCYKPWGKFPPVDGILDDASKSPNKLEVPRRDLMKALSRVSSIDEGRAPVVVLRLSTDQLILEVRTKFGEVAREVVLAYYKGEDLVCCFSAEYLTAMVRAAMSIDCIFMVGEGTKTRPLPMMLIDNVAGSIAAIHQVRQDWVLGDGAVGAETPGEPEAVETDDEDDYVSDYGIGDDKEFYFPTSVDVDTDVYDETEGIQEPVD